MAEEIKCSMAEYSKPIYKVWDANRITPPKGYDTWLEYWEKIYSKREKK
jgi:hypothetical protein